AEIERHGIGRVHGIENAHSRPSDAELNARGRIPRHVNLAIDGRSERVFGNRVLGFRGPVGSFELSSFLDDVEERATVGFDADGKPAAEIEFVLAAKEWAIHSVGNDIRIDRNVEWSTRPCKVSRYSPPLESLPDP